jgi:ribosomal protein L16 Arg81 hydroxylase
MSLDADVPMVLSAARTPGWDRDLLTPLDADEFIADIYGQRFLHLPGPANRFAQVVNWPTLNTLLREQRFIHPRLRLTKDNQPMPERDYTAVVDTVRGDFRQLDIARLMHQLRGGATLVLDSLDMAHAPVLDIKQSLQRWLGAYVSANLYASWGATHGFAVHWDDHDVFVLQVAGRKRWRIYPPTRQWPLLDDVDNAPKPGGEPAADLMLNSGDVLYLPRGWWHDVTAVQEPSLHLTFAVLRPTNADFLTWAVQQAKTQAPVRQDVPQFKNAEEQRETLQQLQQILAAHLQPAALTRYLHHQREAYALDPRPTLQAVGETDPWQWDQSMNVKLLSTNVDLRQSDSHVVLSTAGRHLSATQRDAAILQRLAAGQPVPLPAVIEACTAAAVGDLVTAGIAALV